MSTAYADFIERKTRRDPERAVKLWSNPGDLVLSPFAGIGSEGYVALKHGRRFVGVELKPSYFETACRNLRDAEGQGSLLAEATA